MGQTQSQQEEGQQEEGAELVRATPHLDYQEQALVARLMEEYPNLDQLMAETVVWDYFRKQQGDEHAACSEAMSGTRDGGTRSPPATPARSSASAATPAESKPCSAPEGATRSAGTAPPASDA